MERLIQPPFVAATFTTESRPLRVGSMLVISRRLSELMCFNISPSNKVEVVTPSDENDQYAFRVKKVYNGIDQQRRKEWIGKLPSIPPSAMMYAKPFRGKNGGYYLIYERFTNNSHLIKYS